LHITPGHRAIIFRDGDALRNVVTVALRQAVDTVDRRPEIV